MKKIKNYLSYKISYILPKRVIYFVLIRAYAKATVADYPTKTPNEIGFDLIMKSWNIK